MISHGLPVYIALEPTDLRYGIERLGGLVRERMQAEPRSRALFVFINRRRDLMKVLTWDGTGVILAQKRLDAGRYELPTPTQLGEQHVVVSDAIFDVIHKGVPVTPKPKPRRLH